MKDIGKKLDEMTEEERIEYYKSKEFIDDQFNNLKTHMEGKFAELTPSDEIMIKGKYNDVTIYNSNVDSSTIEEVTRISNSSAFDGTRVVLMPDAHAGGGAHGTPVGLTIGDSPIIPRMVGFDIGCGVMSVEVPTKENIDFSNQEEIRKLKNAIQNSIYFNRRPKVQGFDFKGLHCYDEVIKGEEEDLLQSLGTVGGGNHFVELGEMDYSGQLFLTVHSGSRRLGGLVAKHYIEKANASYDREVVKRKMDIRNSFIEECKKRGESENIENGLHWIELYMRELELPVEFRYLFDKDIIHYLEDMEVCLQYAHLNRRLILDNILKKVFKLKISDLEPFENVHNYYDKNSSILRKGAISAKEDEVVLIPINARDGIIFGTGRGNKLWNSSAPHGAGRVLSRTQAKEQLSIEDNEAELQNILHSSPQNLEESPLAYRDLATIEEKIEQTVSIIGVIKPLMNFR